MRVGIELIKSTRPFAAEIRWRSWWNLWSTLAAMGACLVAACLDLVWPLRLCASILAGLVIVRVFVIYHDYQHGTILRSSRLADFVMAVCGVLTLNPPSVWRRSHDHHHKHNSKGSGTGIGSYPVMTTKDYAAASRSQRFHYALARHPLTMLCGYFTMFWIGMCLRPLALDVRRHRDAAAFLVLHASLAALLIWLDPRLFLFAFLIPLSIAGALGAYLFYAQHNFPGVSLRFGSDWNYASAALESSSYIRMGHLMRWFTGNIGYHHVHHLNAHIPFYRLPEAMAAMEELRSPRTTNLSPWAVWGCLRLKLWDADQGRMVSFSGS
jgi:acyl-lipid omega-6 desaturase (Delta-12 desaturase)